ncbi:TPA: site-2 protease family protein, partial [Patescibacteria group bacterium]|nr:site-2 protease family protein [Patescibacteria group bacterium]
LDGSKILATLLPDKYMYKFLELERFGFILVMIFVLSGLFTPIYSLVTGIFFRIFNI